MPDITFPTPNEFYNLAAFVKDLWKYEGNGSKYEIGQRWDHFAWGLNATWADGSKIYSEWKSKVIDLNELPLLLTATWNATMCSGGKIDTDDLDVEKIKIITAATCGGSLSEKKVVNSEMIQMNCYENFAVGDNATELFLSNSQTTDQAKRFVQIYIRMSSTTTNQSPVLNGFSLDVVYDQTPPDIYGFEDLVRNTLTPLITFNVRDFQSGVKNDSIEVRYSIDGGSTYSQWSFPSVTPDSPSWTTSELICSFSPTLIESYTQNVFQVRATDKYGNNRTEQFTVKVDVSGPTINATIYTGPDKSVQVANGAVVNDNTLYLEAIASDLSQISGFSWYLIEPGATGEEPDDNIDTYGNTLVIDESTTIPNNT